MKPNFLIESLTSCSGCISTMISLDIFPQFLDKVNLVRCSFMRDENNISENDIALIEGCVSEEKQIDILKNIRSKSKRVIALGTCAAFGGMLALSTVKEAEPISNYIEIDGIIPGCPPPSKLLGNCIIRLLENKEIILPEKNVCADCEFRTDNIESKFMKRINKLMPREYNLDIENKDKRCFLERGILCLGPITRDGCESKCIKLNLPCDGCMGPIKNDFTSNAINFLSTVNLAKGLRKYKGIFYRYSKPKTKR
ncbi:MAG: hypothetical protein KAX10_07900 [Candidatus Lokiarchaeota archaeon]|nr:hypothetical protein [Candidatus Lokiarchaeota archaeon]